jgi:hypothetical protein
MFACSMSHDATSTEMVAMAAAPATATTNLYQRSLLSIMVRTITLNDGKKMPALAWGMGTGGVQKQDTVKLGVQALEAGIVHFDTAQVGGVIGEIATA